MNKKVTIVRKVLVDAEREREELEERCGCWYYWRDCVEILWRWRRCIIVK